MRNKNIIILNGNYNKQEYKNIVVLNGICRKQEYNYIKRKL